MWPGEAQRVRGRRAVRGALRLALVGLLLARNGAAQAPPAFDLDYRVPEGCPDRAWFSARVPEAARPGAQPLLVRVKLERLAVGFEGQLEIFGLGVLAAEPYPLRSRELRGASCPEVLSALAFNLSLFLDELREPPNPPDPVSPAPAAAPPASPAAAPPAPPPATVAPADSAPTPRRADASSGWSPGVIGGVVLRSGLGSGLDLNGRLGVMVSPTGSAHSSYEIGFELGAGLSTAQHTIGSQTVDWEHAWWGARASACPWGFAPLPGLAIAPCLAAELGRYRARAADQPAQGLWFAWLEPVLQLRAGTRFFARGELGLALPVAPLRVNIDGVEVFRQRLGGSAGLILGMLW